jgi:hypothetical protein
MRDRTLVVVHKITTVGTQANRQVCTPDHGGHDRQGTLNSRRRGFLAHTLTLYRDFLSTSFALDSRQPA